MALGQDRPSREGALGLFHDPESSITAQAFVTIVLFLIICAGTTLPGEDAYLAAHADLREARYGTAYAGFSSVAELPGPLEHYARVRAAWCRSRAGDRDGAIDALQAMLEEAPEGPWIRMTQLELAELLKAANRHREAVPLYQAALSLTFEPSWIRPYKWAAATSALAGPGLQDIGFRFAVDYMEGARYTRERRDAASLLVMVGSPALRLRGAETLLDLGALNEAGLALQQLFPAVVVDAEASARCTYLRARWLLANQQQDAGQDLLRALASRYRGSALGRSAAAHYTRAKLQSVGPDAGTTQLDPFLREYAGTQEAGDVLWWWANWLEDQGRYEPAVAAYLQLPEASQGHENADRAFLRAGERLRALGKEKEAAQVFGQLAAQFPRSRYASEALFRMGMLLEAKQDHKGALGAYERAGSGQLGDFYVHRALECLHLLGGGRGMVGANLHVAGASSFLRARIAKKPAETSNPELFFLETPWVQRMLFFGRYGLEEAEWEALYQAQRPADDPDLPWVLRAFGDAGVGGTAMMWADAIKWGEQEGIPTTDRLYVEFPRAYWPIVQEMARETGLDPYLILAVARQESLFRARVQSHAGATGVMQLMPGTAAYVARVEPAVEVSHAAHLTDPSNSFRLGAYYLKRMVEQCEGNLVYALGSYNAGPGNIRKWRRANPTNDLQAFIESMPYQETQGFVRRVLGNYAAYHTLYGD